MPHKNPIKLNPPCKLTPRRKMVKEEIERHLEESGVVRWEQAGFTKGGEILDNVLILGECV